MCQTFSTRALVLFLSICCLGLVSAHVAPTLPDASYEAALERSDAMRAEITEVADFLTARGIGLEGDALQKLAAAIVVAARKHEFSTALVLAVIEVESTYRTRAISHVGARGLMQLLPATAEEMARKSGFAWSGKDTLFDPVANVTLGVAYLRKLTDRFDGDVQVALAA